jgi:NAD(P)-dependent dehydrogenase (short-subunit alcohol dehydrogenase family)
MFDIALISTTLLTPKGLGISLAVGITLCLIKLWTNGPSYRKKVDLTGKTVIITGGNTGIGKETALALAAMNATIVLACRDETKARTAIAEIQNKTGNKNVEYMHLQLASSQAIRKFVTEFKKKYSRLDLLINNAGMVGVGHPNTEDNFEAVFGINHFGPFLLTHLLLDKLLASTPCRVINVSSDAYLSSKLDLEDFANTRALPLFSVYANSKLGNILLTKELVKRYGNKGLTSYSLHPGTVYTELVTKWINNSFVRSLVHALIFPLAWLLLKDPKHGAQTTLKCALASAEELENGGYYKDCKLTKLSSVVDNYDELAFKLWRKSEELLKL